MGNLTVPQMSPGNQACPEFRASGKSDVDCIEHPCAIYHVGKQLAEAAEHSAKHASCGFLQRKGGGKDEIADAHLFALSP